MNETLIDIYKSLDRLFLINEKEGKADYITRGFAKEQNGNYIRIK